MTTVLDDVEACADRLIETVGKDIRIGVPLGLGKPVELINALYARAKKDPSLQLTVLTALSLEKPTPSSSIEKAFLEPFLARVFGDCPSLDYMADLRKKKLPPNVRVLEFFFKAGSRMDNALAQQDYICTNYTFAARDVFEQGCNVSAQVVARRGDRYSLSCNPDTSPELNAMLRASGRRHAVIGLVNHNLPFMQNDAEVGADSFDFIVDHPRYTTTLFSTPRSAVGTADYAIGLHASALVRDGGTLQLGIGALGDAIVHALKLRHTHSTQYRALTHELRVPEELSTRLGGSDPFEQGLYGATEMFVDGFYQLHKAGILKRKVYDFWALQQLINEGRCNPEKLDASVLDAMDQLGVRALRTQDFEILQHHGFFRDEVCYETGHLIAADGSRSIANIADPQARRFIAEKCLGASLRNGIVLHGGFFLGPRDFYDALKNMPDEERRGICMTGVDKVNQLDRNPRLYREQRRHARFLNTGLMATLGGAVVSDGLADGRVISGVGGQYNFVAMAHQVPGGRSILMVRAVRDGDTPSSNIVFNYAHTTIARHLRDLLITEYGIAELRGKTDSEVYKAMLNVADSRFQPELLALAKRSGKIEAGYEIPTEHRNNTPQALEARLAPHRKLLPEYPFGSEFTPEEEVLAKALTAMKARVKATPKWKLALASVFAGQPPAATMPYLKRMKLEQPASAQDKVARTLLVQELEKLGCVPRL